MWAVWSLIVVGLIWWCWTHWALGMTSPVEWIGRDAGIVAQGLGFIAWIIVSRLLTVRIATRIAELDTVPTR
jgi:hypothetical protein